MGNVENDKWLKYNIKILPYRRQTHDTGTEPQRDAD
jgi:hypothetical protein